MYDYIRYDAISNVPCMCTHTYVDGNAISNIILYNIYLYLIIFIYTNLVYIKYFPLYKETSTKASITNFYRKNENELWEKCLKF
jgi:DNA gyrase/topoisomerase IV subunit B